MARIDRERKKRMVAESGAAIIRNIERQQAELRRQKALEAAFEKQFLPKGIFTFIHPSIYILTT
jgi:hypothetical protein